MKSIYVQNTDLTRDKRFTYLASDVVSGGTAMIVQSIIGFQSLTTSSGQIVCIGEIGSEKSEIVRTDLNNAASGTTISLRDALSFDHPQDTKVTIVDWNRSEVQWSATASGSKSTIFAYPFQVQADLRETIINDSSQTSGYYFVRFNETIGNTNSDWSDPIPFGDFDDNSVAKIKKRALDSCNETIDGSLITNEILDQWLFEARREYHQSPGKRPFRRKYNTILGSSAFTGSFRVELPNDVESPYSAENVYGIRIGNSQNLNYYDKKEWDFDYTNKPHSALEVPYTRGISTSIWLTNGRDFAQTGSVSVEGTSISYTKVSGSNNSLTITAHGSWSASAGSDAWQNVYYGLPDKFTVWSEMGGSAYVYFNRPIDTAYIGQNIYADYYAKPTTVNSDADILDEPQYDMYVNYLAARIKQRKSRGQMDLLQDSDYKLWLLKKDEALKNEYLGVQIRLYPDVDYLDYTRRW